MKPGTIVSLKSGSKKMTVEQPVSLGPGLGDRKGMWWCVWEDREKEFHRQAFHEDALKEEKGE